jgi:hypothetical protein
LSRKNTALLLEQTNGGKDLTYDEYVHLLSYAASDYDNGQVLTKGKKEVYQSEIQEYNFDNYKDNLTDSKPFYIDTPVETIQAYAPNYRLNSNRDGDDNRVQMPKELWLSLDDKTKSIWDSIDDKYKNVILGYMSSSPSFPTRSGKPPPKSPTKPPYKSRKGFNIAFYRHLVTTTMTPKKMQLKMYQCHLILSPIHFSDFLINAAKGTYPTPLPPGDTCRVMSTNSKPH